MITQERIKELLHYCPDTGTFTWKNRASRRVRIGDKAGCTGTEGYISIRINYKTYSAHRLAFFYMTGSWPVDQVDHINQTRDDNRWTNLRPVTPQENQKNASMHSRNKSGMTGVCWCTQNGKWRAQIRVNEKIKHLGIFGVKEDAVSARKAANIKYGFHSNHGAKHENNKS